MKQLFSVLTSLLLLANISYGQSPLPKHIPTTSPFVLGAVNEFYSAELKENRTLNVYLPEGYSPDSAITYPVIYLLDGSANEDFIHVTGLVQFLTMIEAMPKSIVVGIANVDRKRDLTFPTSIEKDKKSYPTTGGSATFMAFIEKELLPFIQKTYKTNDTNTIIGQSLGGLFVTELLLKKPGLFHNYIIVSPSLWWSNESLLTAAPKLLTSQTDNPTRIYISVGNEGEQMENDAKNLSEILQKSGNPHTTVSYTFLPQENHLTILHNSLYKTFELMNAKSK